MSNERIGLYEGMFLFPQSMTANLQAAVDHLTDILKKAGATTLSLSKWDDRKLSYEIEGNKRGVYFLVYFNAPAESISDLERRCNQSEELIRMMVTRAEHLPQEVIEANDGSADLASEIKLRSEEATEAASSTSSSVSRKSEETESKPKKKKATKETKSTKEESQPPVEDAKSITTEESLPADSSVDPTDAEETEDSGTVAKESEKEEVKEA